MPTVVFRAEEELRIKVRMQAASERHPLTIDTTGLSDEQAAAAAQIGKGAGITAITGVAGSGKTALLRPVVAAAEADDMDILLLSRNAKLATELGQELNVVAHTLAWLSRYLWTPYKPTLMIIDEAGVIDQHDMLAVLAAGKNPYVQIVAVGDRWQSQPIDRQATWGVIEQETANMDVTAHLSTTYRCAQWADEAAKLRNGDRTAIAAKDNRIHTGDVADIADEVMARQRNGEEALALTYDNETAADISDEVQASSGVTIDSRTRLRWRQQCGVGDTVRTRLNDYTVGVRNGDTWTVVGISRDGIHLKHQRTGGEASIGHDWAAEWVELGYALTADAAQGVTVDRAVVLADGMGRSKLYAAATRGRQAPVYYSSDEEPLAAVEEAIRYDDIADTVYEIMTPLDDEPET